MIPAATQHSVTSSEQNQRGRSPSGSPTNQVLMGPRVRSGVNWPNHRARANGLPALGAGKRGQPGRLLGRQAEPSAPADPDPVAQAAACVGLCC